jgi:hypothetical protein
VARKSQATGKAMAGKPGSFSLSAGSAALASAVLAAGAEGGGTSSRVSGRVGGSSGARSSRTKESEKADTAARKSGTTPAVGLEASVASVEEDAFVSVGSFIAMQSAVYNFYASSIFLRV